MRHVKASDTDSAYFECAQLLKKIYSDLEEWPSEDKIIKDLLKITNKIIIDTNKGKYAKSKGDVLIDDRPKYVTEFESAGGSAILHKNYNTTIKEMEKFKQNEQLNRTQMLAGIIK